MPSAVSSPWKDSVVGTGGHAQPFQETTLKRPSPLLRLAYSIAVSLNRHYTLLPTFQTPNDLIHEALREDW